jgi:hypothetical protein
VGFIKTKKMTMKKIIFRTADVITIITIGKTTNKKIADSKETIVQTSHFSREQFEIAQSKTSMKEFFSADGKVCMDCPFAVSNGAKLSACYTHKMMQYSGFLSTLRSTAKVYPTFESIPTLSMDLYNIILTISEGKFVRFGTYGEPTLLPIGLVADICKVAKNYTGYTHQWKRDDSFAPYFMASVHSADEERIASLVGYRSFVVSETQIKEFISCPASVEQGFKSNCSKCGLCSGTNGKGTKSVNILNH